MTLYHVKACVTRSCATSMVIIRSIIIIVVVLILTAVVPRLWRNIRFDDEYNNSNGFLRTKISSSSSLSFSSSSSPNIVIPSQPLILPQLQQSQHPKANFRRSLLEDVTRDFVPLSCNSQIDMATCQTWSSKFGNVQTIYSDRVTIPCGECVIMDYQMNRSNGTLSSSVNNKITFLDGIDIIGKFVIPESYQIHIETTTIVVQGILEMTSILTTITGQPKIHITMISSTNSDGSTTDNLSFTPVYENALACSAVKCSIGSKGIMVAGGKLNIRGIPPDTPTWVHVYDIPFFATNNDTVFLPKSIFGKWNVGAEVVITPHTSVWDATQVRKIRSISSFFSPNPNYVTVRFNESIIRPTTVVESPDFAVEVALLSRNILFDGGQNDDITDDTAHGGHLMISYTPNVVQIIEGVEISNFGQQGIIGRYPIHFHYCNNVVGSVVSKNTIRQSNQRCIVVHGTNQLKIVNNVAFDTKGHCYMTEDGSETGNEFLYNLGTQIGKPNKLIPNEGPNGNETDHEPSIYWITNPTNKFLGNVAAGSEHSGFWFEPKLRGIRTNLYPNYNPMFEPLTLFKDNVAHSCTAGRLGAIRTYTPGYRPTQLAIFDGLKVYRNVGVGIFIHRCHNILIQNSIVADNHIGIDIDRAEGIDVKNTTIIGESESYRIMKKRQVVSSVCGRRGKLVGLDLHTWKSNLSLAGANIMDVKFRDFDRRSNCENTASIAFDENTLKGGIFEFYATFRDISFQTSFLGVSLTSADNRINLCLVQASEFEMIYVSDADGSLSPSTLLSQGPATLLASDNDQLLTFVDANNCTNIRAGCYHYCRNTCFRSVRYSYEGIGQENLTLSVCKRDDAAVCTTFSGGRRGDRGPHAYIAHLPVGNTYASTLLDSSGAEVTTGTLNEYYEDSSCPSDAVFNILYEGQILVANKVTSDVVLEDSQDTSYDNDDAV